MGEFGKKMYAQNVSVKSVEKERIHHLLLYINSTLKK